MKTKTKTKTKARRSKARPPRIKIKAYGIEWGAKPGLPTSKTLTLEMDGDAPDSDVGEAICDALEKAHPGYQVLAVCWDREDRGGLR